MIWEGIKRRAYSLYHLLWHWPFFKIRNSDFIWKFLNRESISLFEKNRPSLNQVQERILSELNNEGISVVKLDDLFIGKNFFQDLLAYSKALSDRSEIKTKKRFLQFLFERSPILDLKNPFIKVSLGDEVLDIANSYLGMYSKFRAYTLNLTIPVPEGSKEVQSQKWHRDSEDKMLVKIFIYLTDVDESSGPFTYIKNSHSKGKWRKIFPQDPPYGSYPSIGETEKLIPAEDIKVCTAGAGTLIFCDTSGLHKGGFATKNERLMYTGVFTSKLCVNPLEYRYPENFERDTQVLNNSQKYAVTN